MADSIVRRHTRRGGAGQRSRAVVPDRELRFLVSLARKSASGDEEVAYAAGYLCWRMRQYDTADITARAVLEELARHCTPKPSIPEVMQVWYDSKPTSFALAPGDFEPKDRPLSRQWLREEFWQMIDREEPRVFPDLRATVYSAFKERPNRVCMNPSFSAVAKYADALSNVEDAEYLPELTDWCRMYGLQDAWCVRLAVETLCIWRDMEPVDPVDFWKHRAFSSEPVRSPIDPATLKNPLGPPDYDPMWQHWEAVEAELDRITARRDQAYSDQKMHYREHVASNAIAARLVPVEYKDSMKHFTWLVWKAVGKLSYTEIAARITKLGAAKFGMVGTNANTTFEYDSDTIKVLVTRAARLLGLTLRGERGRPRGARNGVRHA